MRILPVIRLSLTTDNTTSPERQLGRIQNYAVDGNHELVPITERDYDLDVSGAVSPFDRPGLGRWLKADRLDEWDALCVAKLDRISRSLFDFTTLVQWLQAHGKSLIVLDPCLDLTTTEGRAMANVLMTFAEYEREIIGARVKDAHDKLVRDKKYTGGMVPFGYRPVKLDKNWGYEIDPEYGPLVQEMADRFLRHETIGSVVRWLNDSGVPCPKDVIRQRKGKPLSGAPWTTGTVRGILKSMAVLGAITDAKGEPLRDEQGVVVYRAPGLISRDTYERILVRLAQNPVPVRANSSPLLRVAFCGSCGGGVYRSNTSAVQRGKRYFYEYYRCEYGRMRDGRCNAPSNYRAEPVERAVFDTLLELVGDGELTEERLIPGRDYSEEAARILEQTQHLIMEIGRARLARKDYSSLQATLDAANAELDRLASLEPIPASLEEIRTGETFRQRWESLDMQGRNALLREFEVKAWVSKDEMPAFSFEPGPLTALEVPRVAIIDEQGLHIVIDLGGLGKLRAPKLSHRLTSRRTSGRLTEHGSGLRTR